ncbi:TlpA family protein disulfide reductase [Candidatus Woesearchaeota archaeon]|nr:TlpA family protein disulfide reductase [Candidatus Woesearchaeota archaeon]
MKIWWVIGFSVFLAACSTGAQTTDPYASLGDGVPVEGETGAIASYAAEVGSQKGEQAPDFTINTVDGKDVTLSRLLLDKPVLVYFWTTWCPACQHDLGVMKEIYPAYKDDFEIIAINMDLDEDENVIRNYLREKPNPGIQFAAGTEAILRDYDVIYTSTKVPVGKNGVILWRGSGEMERDLMVTLFEGLKNS